jgi:hypothetical protein
MFTTATERIVTALFIDEWNDLVPAATVDTSVAFHCDAASSAAPNAILLCVPQPMQESWTTDALRTCIGLALERAKLRAVNPDLLGDAGQILPALLARDDAHHRSLAEMLVRRGQDRSAHTAGTPHAHPPSDRRDSPRVFATPRGCCRGSGCSGSSTAKMLARRLPQR